MDHLGGYQDRGVPFSAWLYRIAHTLGSNWHRARGRRKGVPLDKYVLAGLQGDAPESATETQEERQRLLEAVQRLPEDRQQLLLLKFVERLSNAEIGARMGRSEGAIKSLYHRTLIALRHDLLKSAEREKAKARRRRRQRKAPPAQEEEE